jgi:hypothetical protein
MNYLVCVGVVLLLIGIAVYLIAWIEDRAYDIGYDNGLRDGKAIMLDSVKQKTVWKTTDNYNGIW